MNPLISLHITQCLLLVFQAEYDAMLQEFAGEGIPLVTSSVPADQFAPFLNDLLPLIMSKAVSLGMLIRTEFYGSWFTPTVALQKHPSRKQNTQ